MIQLIGKQTNVVSIPHILWSVNGVGRKIYIECFGPTDKLQAQKDAVVLSHIMKERIFGNKRMGDRDPVIKPVTHD